MAGPIPFEITVNGEDFTIVRTRDDINPILADEQSANSALYTISGNTVVWQDGNILQLNSVDVLPTDEISNSAYTTRQGGTMAYGIKVNFDSGVSSVGFTYGSNTHTFTTSGEYYSFSAEPGNDVLLDVSLKSGYSLSSTSVGTISGNQITVPSDILGNDPTVDITTKSSSSQKSYDLSTSSKWSTLSDGEHTVQIVAKGAGYRDSAKSTSVTVTKGSTGETWVLNPTEWSTVEFSANFTSRNESFTNLRVEAPNPITNNIYYGDTLVYSADVSGGWVNTGYETITFETAPTGDLLAWLQANGTKQGGATLINFTINGTSYQAEQGMTWQQWVDSSYNTGGYIVYNNSITTPSGGAGGSTVTTDSAHNNSVTPTDIITATAYYIGQAN